MTNLYRCIEEIEIRSAVYEHPCAIYANFKQKIGYVDFPEHPDGSRSPNSDVPDKLSDRYLERILETIESLIVLSWPHQLELSDRERTNKEWLRYRIWGQDYYSVSKPYTNVYILLQILSAMTADVAEIMLLKNLLDEHGIDYSHLYDGPQP